MVGVGGLWLALSRSDFEHFEACEVEPPLHRLAQENLKALGVIPVHIRLHDARVWVPGGHCDLVLFSPPFLQNHSAGLTAHQRQILECKHLHAMQEFGSSAANLGRMGSEPFVNGMSRVYCKVDQYLKPRGRLVVVVRNRIRNGEETDEVGQHITLIREAGLEVVGVHPRDLERPTGYQAWKVARDPRTAWVRTEWAVVATH